MDAAAGSVTLGNFMRLIILGCGDAFGSGGRFQTCVRLQGDECVALVDCGATSLTAMKAQHLDPATGAFEFNDPQRISAINGGRAREERLHGRVQPLARARWPKHGQRPGATRELAVEDEKRQPTKMVAMQVAEDDGIDAVRVDAARMKRDVRGRAAIDEEFLSGGLKMKAGIESPAGAERIAASYDGEPHVRPSRSHARRPACASGAGWQTPPA